MIKISVSKTVQRKIRAGYPWIFEYQLLSQSGSGEAGDLGVVYDDKNKFLALGLYDPLSDIRLRILRFKQPGPVDGEFFHQRFRQALELRQPFAASNTTAYRMVHGENDGFPGLVLDRYGNTGVLKLYTAAWLPHLKALVPLIEGETPIEHLVLRMSRNTRRGLPGESPFQEGTPLFGDAPAAPVGFLENGLHFEANVINGPKTGFFLDQRENRARVKSISEGKRVLNVFSFSGAFSVYAFSGQAAAVTEIDSNRHALKSSRDILKLNFPGERFVPPRFRQIEGDAFGALAEMISAGEEFDIVILDPPAFANKKRQRADALNAYQRLAKLGAALTAPGQLMVAASCSLQVPKGAFFEAVERGVAQAGRGYTELERTGHAPDHPIGFEGGEYLKAVYAKIS